MDNVSSLFDDLTDDELSAVEGSAVVFMDAGAGIAAGVVACIASCLAGAERRRRGAGARRIVTAATVVGTDGVPREVPKGEADDDRDRMNGDFVVGAG